MTDVLTPEQRSRNMAAIRSKNTRPELAVRQMLRERATPYRVHADTLPGKPDLVFTKLKKAIFIHGCYWHMHRCRYGRVVAKTNAAFWRQKRASNAERDRRVLRKLKAEGWDVLVVWECWLRVPKKVDEKLGEFLAAVSGGAAGPLSSLSRPDTKSRS